MMRLARAASDQVPHPPPDHAVVQAYQRSSMLERRRPVLASWAQFVCGSDADNDVVPMKLVTA